MGVVTFSILGNGADFQKMNYYMGHEIQRGKLTLRNVSEEGLGDIIFFCGWLNQKLGKTLQEKKLNHRIVGVGDLTRPNSLYGYSGASDDVAEFKIDEVHDGLIDEVFEIVDKMGISHVN